MPNRWWRIARTIVVVPLVGCAAESHRGAGQGAWQEELGSRFNHSVPFETRGKDRGGDDSIEILEVLGTRPAIEVGGEYVVRGRYRLSSFERGRVVLYETENGGSGTSTFDVDLQTMNVERGQGTFTLLHAMPVDGWLHVDLYGLTGTAPTELCSVYFGRGQSLYPYAPTSERVP
jgi:hypothetical protein